MKGMIPDESRMPEIGTSGSTSGERKRGYAGGPVRHLQMAKAVGIPQNSCCLFAKVRAPLLDSTANKARGAVWRSQWREGLGATGDAKERPCSEHRVGKPLDGLDAGPERSGTAVPEGCRHNRSEEPDALAGPSGSGRGPSGNRRATATCSAAPARSAASRCWRRRRQAGGAGRRSGSRSRSWRPTCATRMRSATSGCARCSGTCSGWRSARGRW